MRVTLRFSSLLAAHGHERAVPTVLAIGVHGKAIPIRRCSGGGAVADPIQAMSFENWILQWSVSQ